MENVRDNTGQASPVAQLKAGTADLHRLLDHVSLMSGLLKPGLTLELYADVLRRMHGCYQVIERAFDDWLGAAADDSRQVNENLYRRTPELEADLHALNAAPPVATGAAGTLQFHSQAEVTGCLYVVAGSTLGARMIDRAVQAQLGSEVESARRFFGGAPDILPGGWPAMCKNINNDLADEQALQAAITKAREIFSLFIGQMAEDGARQP